jgi:hypothetical protein
MIMKMKPALEITLESANRFGETLSIVRITGDNEEAWIRISKKGDTENEERSVMLDPHEIDVFTSALNLFKNRILNPKENIEE